VPANALKWLSESHMNVRFGKYFIPLQYNTMIDFTSQMINNRGQEIVANSADWLNLVIVRKDRVSCCSSAPNMKQTTALKTTA